VTEESPDAKITVFKTKAELNAEKQEDTFEMFLKNVTEGLAQKPHSAVFICECDEGKISVTYRADSRGSVIALCEVAKHLLITRTVV
jgi:hypothetical protein